MNRLFAWSLLTASLVVATVFLYRLLSGKMQPRNWILIYSLFVVSGVSIFLLRDGTDFHVLPKLEYRAARRLPMNHLMKPADLEKSDETSGDLQLFLPDPELLSCKYLIATREKGNPILASDLTSSPIIHVPSGFTVWTLPSDLKEVPDYMDAGKSVLVFGEGCITAATIAAAHCGKDGCKSMEIFVPLIEVPKLSAAKSLKLQAANAGEPCPNARANLVTTNPTTR